TRTAAHGRHPARRTTGTLASSCRAPPTEGAARSGTRTRRIRTRRSARRFAPSRVVSATVWLILFFLSGATGLLYAVVWTRMLTIVLGASIYSTAVVFAAFMLGLGLGNLAAARLLARV